MKLRPVLAIVAVVAFIVLPNLVDFLLEWLWFGAIGYRDVFVTSLRAQASLGSFVLHFAFLGLYGFPGSTCISVNEEVVHGRIADDDDNKVFYLDIKRPQLRYGRLVVSRATQNATVSAVAVLYGQNFYYKRLQKQPVLAKNE